MENNNEKTNESSEQEKVTYLEQGKEINNIIKNNKLKEQEITEDEEKAKLIDENNKLEQKKADLKSKISSEAMERCAVDFEGKKISPSEAIKKYNNKIEELKKQKQELRLQKIGKKQLIEEKKSQMNEQFNIAVEKYKGLLEAKKITQELFDSRMENMKAAKEKDYAKLDISLDEFDEKIKGKNAEIDGLNSKLLEAQEKADKYEEYKTVYNEMYEENLDSIFVVKDSLKQDEVGNNEKAKVNVGGRESNNQDYQPINNNENKEKDSNEKVQNIVITSKSKFDELYKKLSRGQITDSELNALTDALKDEKNYDKYGITTGLIFNKAKKILKAQGGRTFKNIENFLKEASFFSDDIKFDTSIEENNILSHEVLNSWKDIDDKLVFTDATFSIDKYIQKIEEYKNAGNELTKEQNDIYDKAMAIKESLSSYRKAVNKNQEVIEDRDVKNHNSSFYNKLRNKFKKESTRALPNSEDSRTDRDFIVDTRPLDLSGMVNDTITETEIENSSDIKSKNRGTRDDKIK